MLSQTILRCPCEVLLILRIQVLADAQAVSTFQFSLTGVPDLRPLERPPWLQPQEIAWKWKWEEKYKKHEILSFELFWKNSSYVSGMNVCIFVALWLCLFGCGLQGPIRLEVLRVDAGLHTFKSLLLLWKTNLHERGQSPTLSRASCMTVHLVQIGFSQWYLMYFNNFA